MALQAACTKGRIVIFNLLVDFGVSINTPGRGFKVALNTAAAMGNHNLMQHLLHIEASLLITDSAGHTPIYLASKFGHLDVVRLLLEKGADLSVADNDGCTPLNSAADRGHLDVVGRVCAI